MRICIGFMIRWGLRWWGIVFFSWSALAWRLGGLETKLDDGLLMGSMLS